MFLFLFISMNKNYLRCYMSQVCLKFLNKNSIYLMIVHYSTKLSFFQRFMLINLKIIRNLSILLAKCRTEKLNAHMLKILPFTALFTVRFNLIFSARVRNCHLLLCYYYEILETSDI